MTLPGACSSRHHSDTHRRRNHQPEGAAVRAQPQFAVMDPLWPLAGATTAVWFLYLLWELGRATMSSAGWKATARRLTVAWFVYCIPIHLHGVLPMIRSQELLVLGTTGENPTGTWLGAYPSYCKADARFCGNDIFVQMVSCDDAPLTCPCAHDGVVRRCVCGCSDPSLCLPIDNHPHCTIDGTTSMSRSFDAGARR